MARKTGKLAAIVARRLDQPIVFATAHPNHSVRPKEVAEEIWIACEIVGQGRHGFNSRRADDGRGLFQVVTWTVAKAMLHPCLRPVEPFHGMAKATDLC